MRLSGFKRMRRADQGGGMEIMPAGMHLAGMRRGKREPCLLLNRQRVDVRPKRDDRPLLESANLRDQPRRQRNVQDPDVRFLQPSTDTAGRLDFLVRQLRVPVQLTANLHEPFCRYPGRPLNRKNIVGHGYASAFTSTKAS
ncbi:hypothetical protein D3C74_218500 [compost metagenome]